MRSFSKKLAFVLAAAMVFTSFAPAAKAEAAKEMVINKSSQILYVTDGDGINDAAQVGGGKGNVSEYDFYVKNKPDDWKKTLKFEWSSSDEDVATVNQSGLTTAVGVGKATISCKITEKKTGDVVTTSKVKVTVKANAAEVEISNAATVAGAYEVGATVDLNRVMYDADGNKTSKRGTLVTDYTEWLVEPKTGVEITQSNGKYTFTEPGEYTLWCRTYQSSKYPKTTAESEKITVVIEDKTFDVAQVSSRVFNLVFGMKTTVKPGDVTVLHNIVNTAGVTESYELLIKNVEMNADGTAKVTLFDPLEHEGNYTIKVKGREDKNYTAHVGEPKKIVVLLKGKAEAETQVSVGSAAELDYKLYDAKNIDVTREYDAYKNYIEYAVYDEGYTGAFGLLDDSIYFDEAGDKVTIVAKYYPSVPFDEFGNELEPIVSAPKTFVGVQAGALKLGGLTAYGLFTKWTEDNQPWNVAPSWTNDWSKSIRIGDDFANEYHFYAKVATSDSQKSIVLSTYGQEVTTGGDDFFGYANFTALNPDVLSIYEAEGTSKVVVVPNAIGTAVLSVSTIQNLDGRDVEPTIGLAYITVKEARKLVKAQFEPNNITISANPADNLDTTYTAGVETTGNTTKVENMTQNVVVYDQDTPGWWSGQYTNVSFGEIVGTNRASQKTIDDGAVVFEDGQLKICNREFEEALLEMFADLSYDIHQKTGSYKFGYKAEVIDNKDYNNVKYATFTINVRRHIVDDVNHQKGHSVQSEMVANNNLANVDYNIVRHEDVDNNNNTSWTAEKSLSFNVYEYCNTAKFDEIEFTALTNSLGTKGKVNALSGGTFVADPNAGNTSKYFFKILRNGKDVTKAALENVKKNGSADEILTVANNDPKGAVATYRLSTVDKSNIDTGRDIVYYANASKTIGEGRYEFVLYSVADKDGAYKRLGSKVANVKVADGKYEYTFRNEVELGAIDAVSIFKCFAIKDQYGNALNVKTVSDGAVYEGSVKFGPDWALTAERDFYIDADLRYFNGGNNNNGDTLFVKKIVFWEEVETDVYAEYVVNINKYVDYRYFTELP